MAQLKAHAAALYLFCPNVKCPGAEEGIVDSDTGSYMIHSDSQIMRNGCATCSYCGKTFDLPKTAKLF